MIDVVSDHYFDDIDDQEDPPLDLMPASSSSGGPGDPQDHNNYQNITTTISNSKSKFFDKRASSISTDALDPGASSSHQPAAPHSPTKHFTANWFRSNTRKIAAAVPETPYLVAGAFGGPLVISGLTPFRNAMTLGAQDKAKSGIGLYRQVFRGSLTVGWTGGFYPGIAAIPQFMILGPFFHLCRQLGLPTAAAVLSCGAAETLITFGSQTRNAQLAYMRANPGKKVALQNPLKFWGAGMWVHMTRNAVALSGFRLVSSNIRDPLETLTRAAGFNFSRGKLNVISDFSGCLCSAMMSAPINQVYNYVVVTPSFKEQTVPQRLENAKKYLRRQYLDEKGRVTKVVRRDLAMRCIYVASAFSIYGFIERETVTLWRNGGHLR